MYIITKHPPSMESRILEGVKMALDRGVNPPAKNFLQDIGRTFIGYGYGLWLVLMLKTECGQFTEQEKDPNMTMLSDWDYTQVRDFEYLNELWGGRDESDDVLHSEIFSLGDQLTNRLELPIAVQPLNEEQSAFFKTVYQNPSRSADQQFIDRE